MQIASRVCKIFNFLTITRLRVCNCIKIVYRCHLKTLGLIQNIKPFFCTFIGVRVSYVLDIINKDSSNNDIFYNECVLVIVLFAKRFERVVSNYLTITARWFQLLNDYSKMVSK